MNYRSKSNDSFKSRLKFYIFSQVLKGLETVDKNDFMKFDTDEKEQVKFVDLYVTEYQQFSTKFVINSQGNKKTNNEVYYAMKALEEKHKSEINTWRDDFYENVFKVKFPKDEFEKLEKKQCCYYCGVPQPEIDRLIKEKKIFKKNERGFNLELDRKEPNKEYSAKNCVMACYWCNNAKTDEFSEQEFIPIAEGIREVWKRRGAQYSTLQDRMNSSEESITSIPTEDLKMPLVTAKKLIKLSKSFSSSEDEIVLKFHTDAFKGVSFEE